MTIRIYRLLVMSKELTGSENYPGDGKRPERLDLLSRVYVCVHVYVCVYVCVCVCGNGSDDLRFAYIRRSGNSSGIDFHYQTHLLACTGMCISVAGGWGVMHQFYGSLFCMIYVYKQIYVSPCVRACLRLSVCLSVSLSLSELTSMAACDVISVTSSLIWRSSITS